MAKNIDFMGATFPDVPSIRLPQHEGGLVSFTDVTDTTAVASDVANGKYFYTADGEKTVGTASGGITPSGTIQISQNGQVDVTQYAIADVNVSGGGGESKNVQVVQGTKRTTSQTLTTIGEEMTVGKTGTYDVYWSAFRSSISTSYTYGTQLFIDDVAYGTENTTWSNHDQNNHLSNVSLTANQKIRVYGRCSRGSSYYIYAPTLVIVEA